MKHLIALIALSLAGCATHVEIVGGDAPVQLAEPVTAYVYVTDPATGRAVKSGNRVTVPAYYVCFPPALVNGATTQAGK